MVSLGNIRQVEKKGMKRMTKLSKSVSVAELMHMREKEHLSNQDIAKRLGISVKTVYAYIGKQPSGMRKPWGSNRKKDELPALSENTEVPEMPHKSFKERLEEMDQRHGALAEQAVSLIGDVYKKLALKEELGKIETALPTLTSKEKIEALRKAQRIMNEIAEAGKAEPERTSVEPPYRLESYAEEVHKRKHVMTNHLSELVAVFGQVAVRQYLCVALYDNGIPDCRPMTRTDMLAALESLNKEVNLND